MFVDEAEITVRGGSGGPGKVAFFVGRNGPSGGNGGRGGNVYAIVSNNVSDLKKYNEHPVHQAESGAPGGANRRSGINGQDLFLPIPIGTTVVDLQTKDEKELVRPNDRLLLCLGGVGGFGNEAFKTATYRTPKKAGPGDLGQEKNFKLILKLIAEYGFIGLPNAGKSSLLNALTKANVKTANYPFTTLEPNLGVYEERVLADIPGLIEGASQGRGLGIKFLKHIEKVHLLLHCLSAESDNLERDYRTVMSELLVYNPMLLKKKSLLLLTKIDLISPGDLKKKVAELKKLKLSALAISIYNEKSLNLLKDVIKSDTIS